MLKLLMNNYVADVKFLTFPGGEEHVMIKKSTAVDPSKIVIVARLTSAQERERLDLLVDAVRRMFVGVKYELVVHLQYLPFARQDRNLSFIDFSTPNVDFFVSTELLF